MDQRHVRAIIEELKHQRTMMADRAATLAAENHMLREQLKELNNDKTE